MKVPQTNLKASERTLGHSNSEKEKGSKARSSYLKERLLLLPGRGLGMK